MRCQRRPRHRRRGLGELSVALPLPALPTLDLSGLPGGGVLPVPLIGSVDIRPALAALVAPAGPLLAVSGVTATVTASCQSGTPAVGDSSKLGSLSVLGTKLATDEATERTLRLDSQSIDLRHTNRARYVASIGKERSLALKLDRRMIVTAVRQSGGRKLTLIGRISLPLANPIRTISVKRRISCGSSRIVARVKPDSRGRFSVRLQAPRADRVYTFRFESRVPFSPSYPKLYETYTLPQYVVGR